jgi:uncharacterized protein (DUF1786 family)
MGTLTAPSSGIIKNSQARLSRGTRFIECNTAAFTFMDVEERLELVTREPTEEVITVEAPDSTEVKVSA